jgi:hypothetical protein
VNAPTALGALARCVHAETLKLRRTLALALALLLPAAPPLLLFVFVLQRGSQSFPEGVSAMAWTFQGALSIWCTFLLAPFAAIETSLLAGIEHHNRGFKHLMALPVPRGAVYGAKLVAALALLGIGTACFFLFTLLALWGLAQLRPDAGFVGSLPIREMLAVTASTGAASLLPLAVHAFVALRWPSFALNVGLAMAALLGSLVLVDSRLIWFYPWSLPTALQNVAVPLAFDWGVRATPGAVTAVAAGAVGGALAVAAVGVWHLTRRDVP